MSPAVVPGLLVPNCTRLAGRRGSDRSPLLFGSAGLAPCCLFAQRTHARTCLRLVRVRPPPFTTTINISVINSGYYNQMHCVGVNEKRCIQSKLL